MKCKNCGTYVDEGVVRTRKIPMAICHKCGCEFETTITGAFVENLLFDNGELIHLYAVEPYLCPKCDNVFRGHEFYCKVTRDSGFEGLEAAARGIHPNMEYCSKEG